MRYRKKPIEVEAVQAVDRAAAVAFAGAGNIVWGRDLFDDPACEVWDALHESWIAFEPGDWIINGVQGEFYPVKADVFEQTYEPVEESL